jgi:hypothetical protein
VSCSWADPHFASLYARREEQRLAERLLVEARKRAERLPELDEVAWRRSGWLESTLHGSHTFRLT